MKLRTGLAAVLVAAVALPLVAQSIPSEWEDVPIPELRSFEIPEPARKTFGNGLEAFVFEDHELPLVTLIVQIRAASRWEPADKVGLATLWGQTWRNGGTARLVPEEFELGLEKRAIRMEVSVDRNRTLLIASCLVADLDYLLDQISALLREPGFAEEKLETARRFMTAEIARRNDDPLMVVSREAGRLGRGADHPFSRRSEYATVGAVTRDDLLDWHRRYVQPGRTQIGVVGDVQTKDLLKRLKRVFGSWSKGPAVAEPAVPTFSPAPAGYYLIEREDVTQANIRMVGAGVLESDPDYYAIEVMNAVFSGGFSARLFKNVRSTKGLGYQVDGSLGTGPDLPGLFTVSLDTKSGSTIEGIEALYEEIDAMVAAPPSVEEVKWAKDVLLNSFVFRVADKSDVLVDVMRSAYFGLPGDRLTRYQAGIQKVTAADVHRVAKTHLDRDDLRVLVLGRSADFDRPLDSLGPVTPIDISIPEPPVQKAAATAESRARGEEVLRRALDTIGGVDRLAAVRGVLSRARVAMTQPMPMEISGSTTIDVGGRLRQEMATPMGQIVVVATFDDAFMAMAGQVQPVPDSQRGSMLEEVWRTPFSIARGLVAGELEANWIGEDQVDGAVADVVEVTNQGIDVRFAVDRESGRIVRESYRTVGEAGPVEMVVLSSDFRKVGDFELPFLQKSLADGEEASNSTVEQIVIDPPIADQLFARPE